MSSTQVVTLFICALVAVGTGVGLAGGVLRMRRILRALRPGLALARSLSARPDPEAAFEARWDELDASFRNAPILAPAWVPFAASIERAPDGAGSRVLASSSAPEDWLQARYLAAGGWTDVAVARLAGLLVSLGILGTFLGLTLGLVEADFDGIQALSSADERTEALQAAMFGLLAGSSTAFVTSVAGLAGSLVLTAVVRLGAMRPVERALVDTSVALRVGIRIEPPEVRLTRQLSRMADQPAIGDALAPILQRLTTVLESSSDEAVAPLAAHADPKLEVLFTEVRDALRAWRPTSEVAAAPDSEPAWAASLAARLDAPVKGMEISPDLRELIEAQQRRLSEVVDAFAVQDRRLVALDARLRSVADGVADRSAHRPQLHAVTASLEELVELLKRSSVGAPDPAALRAVASTAMGDSVRISLAPTLESLTRVSQQFSDASGRFDDATGRWDAAARSNQEAAETLRGASAALGTRLAVLQQATAALRTGLAHHTDASNALTVAAASLQGVGPQFTRAADQVKLGASAIEVATDRMAARQQPGGGAEAARLGAVLEKLLVYLEQQG